MPVQGPTRSQPFPRSRPISDAHVDTEDLFLNLNPRVRTGVCHFKIIFVNNLFPKRTFKILNYVLNVQNLVVFKNIVAFRHVTYFTCIILHVHVNTRDTFAQKYVLPSYTK